MPGSTHRGIQSDPLFCDVLLVTQPYAGGCQLGPEDIAKRRVLCWEGKMAKGFTRSDKRFICILTCNAVMLGIRLGMHGVSLSPWVSLVLVPLSIAVIVADKTSQ